MRRFLLVGCLAPLFLGCTSNLIAAQVGGAFTQLAAAYSRDDDPDLVWEATPFALKTIDGLILSNPQDRGLLLAAASGYTQYAYGSLVQDADFVAAADHDRSKMLRGRAKRLLIRGRDYGLRSIEVGLPEFRDTLRRDPAAALKETRSGDVPALYWTACAWGAAISLATDDSELTADQFIVEALMRRVLELNERYEGGAGHDFFIAYESARAGAGGSYEAARKHFERAVFLSEGARAWPYVTLAESVFVPEQKREDFLAAIEKALEVPSDSMPEHRLANTIARRRARWLRERVDDLFLEP